MSGKPGIVTSTQNQDAINENSTKKIDANPNKSNTGVEIEMKTLENKSGNKDLPKEPKNLEKKDEKKKMVNPWTNKSIENSANIFNKIFFFWTGKIVDFGNKTFFSQEDLFEVRDEIKFAYAWKRFAEVFERTKKSGNPSVQRSLYEISKLPLFAGVICNFIGNMIQFAGPYLLKAIVKYVGGYGEEWEGYLFAFLLFLAFFFRAILMQHGMNFLNVVSFRSASAMQALVLDKLLKLRSTTRNYLNTGKIITTSTIDAFSVYGFFQIASLMISTPFVLVISIVLVIVEIGPVGFCGLAMIIVGTFLSSYVTKKFSATRKENLKFSDRRSKSIEEFISGIRLIKYYGWEKMVISKIQDIRNIETHFLFIGTILRATMDFIVNLTPLAINISVFGLYVASGNDLTPTKAYATLSLFNIVQTPIRTIAFVLLSISSTKVSVKRMQHYTGWEEIEKIEPEASLPVGSLYIKDGNFGWDNETVNKHWEDYQNNFDKKPEPKKKNAGKKGKSPLEEDKKNEEKPLVNEKKDYALLKDINLQISPGEFVAIIGQVGTGKSSLLAALIGEMDRISGTLGSRGRIAYIPQTAWLQNATLKNNVLFGSELDQERYEEVIRLCELGPDIDILPGKDSTEIGERGINLSGGQKQRVSIARALYFDADIYLLDDCLSALDAHVGQKIYQNILRGKLKGKTIVFVTHALQYINEADRIIVMKGGRIEQIGTMEELKTPNSEFNRLTMAGPEDQSPSKKVFQKQEAVEIKKPEASGPPGKFGVGGKPGAGGPPGGRLGGPGGPGGPGGLGGRGPGGPGGRPGALTSTEVKAEGSVSWKVYSSYLRSGGYCNSFLVLSLFLISQGVRVFTDWWLTAWSTNIFDLAAGYYILYYFFITIGSLTLIFFRSWIFGLFTRKSSIGLQKKLILSIFRSPMSWFDTTPSGRILNRASKDQDDVDTALPFAVNMALQNMISLIATMILIGVITYYFFALAVVLLFFYGFIVKKYLRASRELKRIASITRSPAIMAVSEASTGYMVVRAFGKQKIFENQLEKSFDQWIKATHNGFAVQRWIGLRSDLFASLTVGGAALFCVLSRSAFSNALNPGLVGLSLSYALQLVQYISFTVRLMADAELQMNSVERILEYINKKDHEADWESPNAPEGWPSQGQITAENIAYKYRPELDYVIKGISFSIKKCEKIGVVGRTGSGKSTLTLGLLRILEIAEKNGTTGKISFDDLDISKIGLHRLRQKVTIIPQDPTLFSGTIKSNVDPFNEFKDEDIVQALKKVDIWKDLKTDEKGEEDIVEKKKTELLNKKNKKKASSTAEKTEEQLKLGMKLADKGGNFSQGQRQLLCMARALLRKSKILLMDEATASIDEKTDSDLQKMIKQDLKDTTVITIAHRLNTIIQYDKILVMEDGIIREYGAPLELLNNRESAFAKLVSQSGEENESKLRYLAEHKELDVTNVKDIKIE